VLETEQRSAVGLPRVEVFYEGYLRNSTRKTGGHWARPAGNRRPPICRSITCRRRRQQANWWVSFVHRESLANFSARRGVKPNSSTCP